MRKVLVVAAVGLLMFMGVDVGAQAASNCAELEITEVYTNFRDNQSEQFVEFFGKFYEGGGVPFAAFKLKNKYVQIKK